MIKGNMKVKMGNGEEKGKKRKEREGKRQRAGVV